ncbi:Tubulin monoglutamylase TTLL4 [Acropora cervicornis]|uniref:Tubulin monoglutamylase TTLL4 n=1 Tax=Acropora cervicornis TaxID=6130 RepID=A0AAD9QYZ7_ACRCE|nr:Tubulin monoglutamylase TTLL4 [Acropora cervicornis]
MNSKTPFEKSLSSKLSNLQISKQSSGLSRAKATPLVLKAHLSSSQKDLKFVPHPPQRCRPVVGNSTSRINRKGIRPVPPSQPKSRKGQVCKFYAVKKQDGIIDEGRVSGDGESLVNEEDFEKSRCPSWERMPGDGCISDIAEEDEDSDKEEETGFSDVGDNDGYDDEDGCESVISSAASSRVSTAKTRASSARFSHSRRGSGPVGSSKPLSSVPHKKSNAWTSQTDAEKQEKQSPLVQSLFAHLPPTIYFFVEEERVALLPTELRKLLRWKMSSITPNVIKQCIARAGFKPTKRNDWLGYWGKHMKASCFKSVREYQKEYGFVPQTFVLPYDFKLLKRAWEDGNSRQKWILKPQGGLGFEYLAKPYLINDSKFDLRIYVYVTSYDPLRIYVFEDGLVRFATCKYSTSMKTLSNKFMHLTNYSINKKNEGAYEANSDENVCQGHKWSLKALWGYMKRINVNFSLVWETIKDLVVKTIIASCCHELFGFDVMLDENLKPWLLEVNISPSLHSTSQLDRNIKGQMIKDLLNLAGTPVLSADERAKHAFYVQSQLSERAKQSILDLLTPDDMRILMETEDENSRRGCFQRVFPSMSSNKFLRFFESQRYYNILLDEWTRKYMREGRSTALGIAVLQGYAEKGLHLGPSSDPNHQWRCAQGMAYRSFSAPVLGLDHGFTLLQPPPRDQTSNRPQTV